MTDLTSAAARGGLFLGVVSVAAYSIWAWRLVPGTAPLYAAIALVYLLGGGWALARLVPGARRRSYPLVFAGAFAGYAMLWCVCWFGLRGRYHADLHGATLGLVWFTWLHARAFQFRGSWFPPALVLIGAHAIGYAAGETLHELAGGPAGRLLWGAAHGVGFGAGAGALLHWVTSTTPGADPGTASG